MDFIEWKQREQATLALAQLGDRAEGSLKQALQTDTPLETRRRLATLLDRLGTMPITAATLREVRAVEALESIGNPAALRLLQDLARGAPGARLTEEARESLARMDRTRH